MSRQSAGGADDLREQDCDREMYREMLGWLDGRVDPEPVTAGEDGMFTEQDRAFLRERGITDQA